MAAVDPDVALRLAKAIADLYGDAAARMLQMVAQRLAAGIDEPGWAEAKLAELLQLRDDAAAVVAQLTADAPALIEQAIVDANTAGITATGIEPTLAPITNQAAVNALAAETVTAVTAPHTAILRTVLDVYRTVIAETAAPGVVTGIETRRQAAQRALNRFADQGITGFVDKAGRRWELQSYAEMATRTASGRAMVEGRLAGYRTQGRTLVIVSDAPQECSACRPFEGQLLSIDGAQVGERHGGIDVVDTVNGARAKGLFHANCFPAEVVVSGPPVRAADARWYEGDLVVIHTAGGDELPVTPNHPVLTAEGWIAAGSLHVGDQLVRHLRPESMHLVGPHDQRVPPMIGDVAGALRKSGAVVSVSVPASPEQFHGDGVGGHVDVVFPDGALQRGLDVVAGEPSGDASFIVGGVGLGALLAERAPFEVALGSGHPPHRVMRRGHLGSPLLCRHGRPLPALRLAPADPHPAPTEEVRHGRLVDAEGAGDLRLALAGQVALDDVVALGRRQVACHVFNLQTEGGWYTANGIVVHNCRHDLRPYIDGLTKPMTHTADPEGDRARQEQRRLERGVRQWKRREAVALDDTERRKAAAKRAEWSKRLADHVAGNNLKRLRYREQIGSAR